MTRVRRICLAGAVFALLPALLGGSTGQFSPASPESVGMSSARLRQAVESVQTWVREDRIVGAVMLVIRSDRIVLHEAVGWNDRERRIPMARDAICQMRSMTKPLVGTAILMLQEDGRLDVGDKVSKHLPAFDNPRSREITIHQLLTHTSGITGAIYEPLGGTKYTSLREAVDEIGRKGPEYPSGTRYHYSDPGTSALGAIIAQLSGMPAESFIQQRLIDPLEMTDSFCVLRTSDPRASRVAVAYQGGPGKWTKYWDLTKPEVVPFFRASGGVHASAIDYAKFMAMMLRGGRFGDRRFLAEETVRLATRPHADYVYTPAEAAKSQSFYGLHWQVFTDKYRAIESPLRSGIFGHAGSDGTYAWTDPSRDLIGIYLTQSRGSNTSREFMRLVQAAIVE